MQAATRHTTDINQLSAIARNEPRSCDMVELVARDCSSILDVDKCTRQCSEAAGKPKHERTTNIVIIAQDARRCIEDTSSYVPLEEAYHWWIGSIVTYHSVGNDASDRDCGETILWIRNRILDDLVALIICLSISLSDTLEIILGIACALNLGARHDANPGCRRMFGSKSWEEEASQDSKDLKECCADP